MKGSHPEIDRDWTEGKPRIGISSCLLGEPVRYNGQHQRDRFLTDTVGQFVEWVPVCPEVECGLSVPREAMRLVGDPDDPRLVTSRTGRDMTEKMVTFARERVQELEDENLCGFIFKSKSPSSGMERVKVYDENGVPQSVGVGMFAREFMDHFPLVPVEEDGRLHDSKLREKFFENIFCFRDYRRARASGEMSDLIRFHTRHKLQLMAHSPEKLKEMGRVVATAQEMSDDPFQRYEELLREAMGEMPSRGKNANVIHHMLGYFKDDLSSWEKQELVRVTNEYHEGLVPLVVPVTLVEHYVRKYDKEYLGDQSYLRPHPVELKLRNHA
ncbi:MAG: DUF1722 domain-containing protein [Planctomycetes bacterium]|nr:DUF1722 domain-containing protein [Planctomycetota bacterium]